MTITDVVKARLSRSLDFKCSQCGYAGQALLTVTAEGEATRNATSADSREVARERAEHGSHKAFERASLIIPCPDCATLDPEKLSRYRKDRAFTLAIILVPAVIGFAVALSTSELGTQRMGWMIGGAFALCCLQPLMQMFRPPSVDVTFSHSATPS